MTKTVLIFSSKQVRAYYDCISSSPSSNPMATIIIIQLSAFLHFFHYYPLGSYDLLSPSLTISYAPFSFNSFNFSLHEFLIYKLHQYKLFLFVYFFKIIFSQINPCLGFVCCNCHTIFYFWHFLLSAKSES